MRIVEVDDDIYEYLRRQQTTFSGETASEVLRRLLKLTSPVAHSPRAQHAPPEAAQQLREELMRDEREKALWKFVNGPQFQSERTAVGKFISLLAFLYRENRATFATVQGINGRSRKYFAKSESELGQSGTSVHPKAIPGSEYWVVTNNSTQSKCELIVDVLKLLGYRGALSAYAATHIN